MTRRLILSGWTCLILLVCLIPAHSQIVITSPTLNLSIPDGDFVGISNTQFVPSQSQDSELIDLTLILQVVGDYLGDIYAQVTHDGHQAVILNRVGRTVQNPSGYGDTALEIRLNDGAPQGDVHTYRVTLSGDPNIPVEGALTGLWAPDGRNASPTTVLDTSPRTATLNSFNGLDPQGNWTLFLADVDSGSQHTLVSWGLEITAVPEPEGWAAIFGAVCLGFCGLRRWKGLRRNAVGKA